MVESLQMFLFLFKSKYRRKYSWFSPFLCSVLIVLLFCHGVLSRCEHNCINGVCNNDTCVCYEGWQGPQCQHCGGKIKLSASSGIITDGPGNYSVSTQCSWLITPPRVGPTPPTVRVRLESFATECGWDHLYIYDGDSVRAEKLLAVFSGMIDIPESNWTRQVIARSGSVLIHFFSDDAYAMEGFNLTYASYSCPSNDHRTNCSDHGECEEGSCRCEPEWVGVACDQPICPNDCNAKYGAGFCSETGCECTPSRTGPDCSRDALLSGWGWAWREEGEGGARPSGTPPPAAGHALLNYGDDLLRVGGEMFQDAAFLYRYRPGRREWEVVPPRGEAPLARFAHTAVVYGEEIIVYGGVVAADEPERGGGLVGAEGRAGLVSNELWVGHVGGPGGGVGWRNATPRTCSPLRAPAFERCGGLHLSGHTAVLVHMGPTQKPVMLVFFGHSPHYGYLHLVQEYYIAEGAWALAAARGAPARGGFAHSAAWDALSGRVYLHAGLVSESESTQAPSAALYEYEVEARIWRPLPSAPTPRYLHSAIFISPGIMLVFGGNAHNDSAAAALSATGASQCYASSALLYNARCRSWLPMSGIAGSSRAGHAAALLPGKRPTVIVHGGFDGRLRSDALLFEAGTKCSSHKDEASCMRSAEHAVACVWKLREKICVGIEEVGWKDSFEDSVKACHVEPVLDEARCAVSSCEACAALGCAWCGSCLPSAHHCLRARATHALMSLSVSECPPGGASCSRYHSCAACHAHLHRHPHGSEKLGQRACYWDYDTVKCRPANSSTDIRSVAATSSGVCSAACATFSTCANCTAEECIWCASAGRCVDKNAYGASFPLGGCRAWSTSGCAGPGAGGAAGGLAALTGGCSAHASCQSCLAEPACGWCDDGAGGGRGACLPGSDRHPHHPQVCVRRRWHFTSCPACQCNGHAVCDAASRCVQPCGGRAFGPHCNSCAPSHWGSPLNGGLCTPCECNGQATSCAAESGRCHCSTKGLAGDRCDKCDNTNHYHADLYNKGCYYDLAVDYQFTFNLSKKEDRHLSAINFRNAPVKPDVDADFSITCSAHARMNLTVRTKSDPERTLFSDINCTNFRYKPFLHRFAKSDHAFGVEDNVTLTTFFVYVYDFKPPLWIQISFSQYPKLNLQQFFITFSSCFLLLLLVAAALWKIKQKYDLYRRRQRLFVEMEQMASRPFSQVSIELERGGGETGVPAPVALEPCRWGRAAVLSLVVRLPAGGAGRAPPQGGLALASALVTLGHAHHAHHDRWRQQCK